jgi:hypothetical protein
VAWHLQAWEPTLVGKHLLLQPAAGALMEEALQSEGRHHQQAAQQVAVVLEPLHLAAGPVASKAKRLLAVGSA